MVLDRVCSFNRPGSLANTRDLIVDRETDQHAYSSREVNEACPSGLRCEVLRVGPRRTCATVTCCCQADAPAMLPPRRRIGTEAKSRLGKALAGPSFLIRISQASLITILLIVFVSFIDLSAYGSPALVPESIHLSAAIRHSGVHIYNDTTAPFFDESTSAFRQRFLEWSARHPADDSIFVSIASFRDNLCRETVAALFANANRPERVFVGICDQLVVSDPDDRPCLDMVDERFRPQIRVVQVPADRGAGPTHARYIASKLWAGETWFMQIDSHTKFLKGWDDHLVAMIKRLPDPERSIVTHYPVGSDTVLGDAPRPWICRSTHDNAPPGLIIQLPETCNDDNMSPGIALDDRGQKTTCFTPYGSSWLHDESADSVQVPGRRVLRGTKHVAARRPV